MPLFEKQLLKPKQMLRFFRFIARMLRPYFVSSSQREFRRLKDFIASN